MVAIEAEASLSDEVVDSKPRNGRVYPVLFFGSLDYAWITPDNLEQYEENLAKYGSKAKNRKDPSFADALKQAQDPSLADEVIQRNAAAAGTSDEEDEDQDEGSKDDDDDDDDVEMKAAESDSNQEKRPRTGGRGRGRGRGNNGRSRTATAGSKRMSLSSNSSGEDAVPETSPKRSRTAAKEAHSPKSESPSVSRRDSDDAQSAARDSPRSASPSTRHSPEHPDDRSSGRDDAKASRSSKGHQHAKSGSKTYQYLMQLRHKLQKTVIKGELPADLAPVSDVLRRLEDFDMTLELIQETKLGKVMRIIAGSDRLQDAPADAFDIKGRAARLAEKWRQLILRLREGSAEPTAPESPLGKSPDSDSRRGDAASSRPATTHPSRAAAATESAGESSPSAAAPEPPVEGTNGTAAAPATAASAPSAST
ncbi:hypothetical protein LPJ70_000114 [Coemansia sp. RSA 2708]|nr:hypothetical protein LPJ70_000114 [Coemansia sp. RSA 2708]